MKKIIATSFKALGFNHNYNICMYLDPQDITRLQSTFKDAVKAIDVLRYEHFGLAPQEGEIKDWINHNVIRALSQMRKTRPDLYRMYVNRFGISQQRIENLIEQGNFGPLYKIVSTNFAFAAICSDGQIRCWGHANGGGVIPENIMPEGVSVNPVY